MPGNAQGLERGGWVRQRGRGGRGECLTRKRKNILKISGKKRKTLSIRLGTWAFQLYQPDGSRAYMGCPLANAPGIVTRKAHAMDKHSRVVRITRIRGGEGGMD